MGGFNNNGGVGGDAPGNGGFGRPNLFDQIKQGRKKSVDPKPEETTDTDHDYTAQIQKISNAIDLINEETKSFFAKPEEPQNGSEEKDEFLNGIKEKLDGIKKQIFDITYNFDEELPEYLRDENMPTVPTLGDKNPVFAPTPELPQMPDNLRVMLDDAFLKVNFLIMNIDEKIQVINGNDEEAHDFDLEKSDLEERLQLLRRDHDTSSQSDLDQGALKEQIEESMIDLGKVADKYAGLINNTASYIRGHNINVQILKPKEWATEIQEKLQEIYNFKKDCTEETNQQLKTVEDAMLEKIGAFSDIVKKTAEIIADPAYASATRNPSISIGDKDEDEYENMSELGRYDSDYSEDWELMPPTPLAAHSLFTTNAADITPEEFRAHIETEFSKYKSLPLSPTSTTPDLFYLADDGANLLVNAWDGNDEATSRKILTINDVSAATVITSGSHAVADIEIEPGEESLGAKFMLQNFKTFVEAHPVKAPKKYTMNIDGFNTEEKARVFLDAFAEVFTSGVALQNICLVKFSDTEQDNTKDAIFAALKHSPTLDNKWMQLRQHFGVDPVVNNTKTNKRLLGRKLKKLASAPVIKNPNPNADTFKGYKPKSNTKPWFGKKKRP